MLQPIRPQDAGQIYQRQIASAEASATAGARSADRPATQAAPGRRTDRVQFSPAALGMSRALQSVADAPDVRESRIEALRAAIEDGSYRVDADGVAQGLVALGFGTDTGGES